MMYLNRFMSNDILGADANDALDNCPRSEMKIYELWSMSRVGSTSMLASDWLHKSEQPIETQDSKLTQLLTMTATHNFRFSSDEELKEIQRRDNNPFHAMQE